MRMLGSMDRSIQYDELEAIRSKALALHTRLLEEARAEYEHKLERTVPRGELLQAVAFGPDFEWLRPLTRFIVELDMTMEQDKVTDVDVAAARERVAQLVRGDVEASS
jgi:hypothetical protein